MLITTILIITILIWILSIYYVITKSKSNAGGYLVDQLYDQICLQYFKNRHDGGGNNIYKWYEPIIDDALDLNLQKFIDKKLTDLDYEQEKLKAKLVLRSEELKDLAEKGILSEEDFMNLKKDEIEKKSLSNPELEHFIKIRLKSYSIICQKLQTLIYKIEEINSTKKLVIIPDTDIPKLMRFKFVADAKKKAAIEFAVSKKISNKKIKEWSPMFSEEEKELLENMILENLL